MHTHTLTHSWTRHSPHLSSKTLSLVATRLDLNLEQGKRHSSINNTHADTHTHTHTHTHTDLEKGGIKVCGFEMKRNESIYNGWTIRSSLYSWWRHVTRDSGAFEAGHSSVRHSKRGRHSVRTLSLLTTSEPWHKINTDTERIIKKARTQPCMHAWFLLLRQVGQCAMSCYCGSKARHSSNKTCNIYSYNYPQLHTYQC